MGHDLRPVSVGVDGSGSVVVTGNASTPAGSIEADKYAGQTGQRIWGPAVWAAPDGNYGTLPELAAVGADGSIVIFGTTYNDDRPPSLLLKFRARTAASWGPILARIPRENAYGASLSLAGNGDPILSAQFKPASRRRTRRCGATTAARAIRSGGRRSS